MDDNDNSDRLLDRDFTRYEGYWHGFTFIIFDAGDDAEPGAWIQSTYWVPVAAPEADQRDDPEDPGEQAE